jgi:hypothetical protein
MDSEQVKNKIREDAAEIVRLRSRIRETYAQRSKSPEKMRVWEQACAEMHSRYSGLAFPGGYDGDVLNRILSGDPQSMEAAICFLEVRPYFFRSGYMFKDILRKCRRAPLSRGQGERLRAVEKRLSEWRERKVGKKKIALLR